MSLLVTVLRRLIRLKIIKVKDRLATNNEILLKQVMRILLSLELSLPTELLLLLEECSIASFLLPCRATCLPPAVDQLFLRFSFLPSRNFRPRSICLLGLILNFLDPIELSRLHAFYPWWSVFIFPWSRSFFSNVGFIGWLRSFQYPFLCHFEKSMSFSSRLSSMLLNISFLTDCFVGLSELPYFLLFLSFKLLENLFVVHTELDELMYTVMNSFLILSMLTSFWLWL